MLNNIQNAHREYIKKYNASPNLLFMGEHSFEVFLHTQKFHWSANLHKTLRQHVALGCLIIRVPCDGFGYGFYEFSDLLSHKDNYSRYTDGFEICKVKMDATVWSNQDIEQHPSSTGISPTIYIPIQVLETFKRYLNTGLKQSEVESMNAFYQEQCSRMEMLTQKKVL